MKSFMRAGAAALALTTVSMAPAGAVLYMYEHINYQGLIGTRSTPGWWNMQSQNNDKLSSHKNITGYRFSMWEHANRGGRCIYWSAGAQDPSYTSRDNDVASSYQLANYGC